MSAERLPLATKDQRANLLRAFKANGCAECGRRYPELDWSELEIDHVDPRDKPRGFTTMGRSAKSGQGLGHRNRTRTEEMLAELLTCQVLCTACHDRKHGRALAVPDTQLPLFSGNGTYVYRAAGPVLEV